MNSLGARNGAGGLRRLGFELSGAVDSETARTIGLPLSTGDGDVTTARTDMPASGSAPVKLQGRVPSGSLPRSDIDSPPPDPGRRAAALYEVMGTVTSPNNAGTGRLLVVVVDIGAGRDDVVVGRTETDSLGRYEVRVTVPSVLEGQKERPDLQVRVHSGSQLVGESSVIYDASNSETLNVQVSANAAGLPSEHDTLVAAVAAQYDGPLSSLREDDERRDITYLANKTGWDARAVALAALSEQFAADSNGNGSHGVPASLYYALFRAGVPANPDAVYGLESSQAGEIWRRAIDRGVVPASLKDDLEISLGAFQRLRATRMLDMRPLAGASSLNELLEVSLGKDQARQQRFAELYAESAAEPKKLWSQVSQAFGGDTTTRLQLDGQLAYLTLNNAPLVARLHQIQSDRPLTSTRDLASRGYYRPESWTDLIEQTPEAIPGSDDSARKANYAEILATQVRLSYPTAVLADRIVQGELQLSQESGVAAGVQAFFTEHQDAFEIGMHPVERFIAKNDLADTVPPPVIRELTRIQRVYQITPTDDALTGLMRRGLDSAFAVARYRESDFVRDFADDLGGEIAARLTHAKATKVHGAVLNIASTYLTARNAPALGKPPSEGSDRVSIIHSGAAANGAAHPSDVIAQATLESLFGSMDFCSCSECRSILSPAAYLVDLLLFADPPTNEKESPQKVLLERRPDLAYLPLTCENTNTPLPYIDIVNETLEYYVAHQSLTGYTGHDTGDCAAADELLASPQYVDETVYDTLREQLFPPPLPFHKSLETHRRYFATFGTPLERAMQALRTSDDVERANASSCAWRDILMEELGLSRDEYRLLTDRSIGVPELYGFPAGTADAVALGTLKNVQVFTRRVGITYADLISILQTRFINPWAWLIPRLERLGVPFSTLQALKDGTISNEAFTAALAPNVDPQDYGGDIKAWILDSKNFARIMNLIVIRNPTNEIDLCAIDKLELQYSSPHPDMSDLRPIEFVRLARFIRLWKRLGWTIAETDVAIAALFSTGDLPIGKDDKANLERLDRGFLGLLPRLGIASQAIDRLSLSPSRDLLGLLACWAPIDTAGQASLYRSMFINEAVAGRDSAFAEGSFGAVLADGSAHLLDHTDSLRAAFSLTADELAAVAKSLAFDASTPLTIDSVSAIYRRGWLARKLRLSVRELLALAEVTVDPFAAPDPPERPLLRFIDWVEALRSASLKPVEALYLIWNQDLSGKSAPDDVQVRTFARLLRNGFAAINAEYAIADDPTGDVSRSRMALAYGNEATDFLFGLIDDTFSVDVAYSHPQATLEKPILDAAPGRIGYDDFQKRLSYTGVISAEARDALDQAAGVTADFQIAVSALYDKAQAALVTFFGRYPELKTPYDNYIASTDAPSIRRTALLKILLATLEQSRKLQQAEGAIGAACGTDLALADAVLGDVTVLEASADATTPAVADLTALEQLGLSARFYWRGTATGVPDQIDDAVPTLEFAPGTPATLPSNPAGDQPISGTWSGFLDAPQNGLFKIAIEADAAAAVRLALGGAPVALTQAGNTWTNDSPIGLTAGTLQAITLTVENVKHDLVVRWETPGTGFSPISPQYLYSETLLDRLRTTYIRFLKTASLALALKLSANDIAHVASDHDLEINGRGWLNSLAAQGAPAEPVALALRDVLEAVLAFARIKREVSPDDEEMLALLKDPVAAIGDDDSRPVTLTGWNQTSLKDLLVRFGHTFADLRHIAVFARVYDAFAVLDAFGISAAALAQATTNDPTSATSSAMLAAVRARYDPADLLQVIRPINDDLRKLRRDALVAYILKKLSEGPGTIHIDTAEKLFEYFLTDVEMDPCALTSRVRHALSSVQLFIERCLMNLETRVAPSSIDPAQWSWMKRYRLWEANRKVFLWPENWLEPELRDDQSPFFKETMSELLQSDITEDAAAVALLNYLAKLEEVAKLEPCGIHFAENHPGTADDVAHVVARTTGAQRKYWYRRANYGYWTPWEQVKLDIEDNPVIPVIWKGRLFLFSLKILKKTPLDPYSLPTTSTATSAALASLTLGDIKKDVASGAKQTTVIDIFAVLCWSEYYNGKWQPAKTSDPDRPTYLGSYGTGKDAEFRRSDARLAVGANGDTLRIEIRGVQSPSSFVLYNTHSPPIRAEDNPIDEIVVAFPASRELQTATDTFVAAYVPAQPVGSTYVAKIRPILTNPIGDGTVEPLHPLEASWDAPFFYEDARNVFFVTTAEATVALKSFDRFGVPHTAAVSDNQAPLIVKQPAYLGTRPDMSSVVERTPGLGKVDPGMIERALAAGTNIRLALGSTGSVSFAGKTIGPSGQLVTSSAAREELDR